MIILNVAGATGLIATNQVYNLAKPDGLTLGAIYPLTISCLAVSGFCRFYC